MEMAERFNMPVVTLIDTPGAYPGIDSEERGISEAIAQNLAVMSRLRTPIVCIVIGRGIIGWCAGYWRRRSFGNASVLDVFRHFTRGMCQHHLEEQRVCAAGSRGNGCYVLHARGARHRRYHDPRTDGRAHRDVEEMARRIREHVSVQLDRLCGTDMDELVEARYQRLMAYGSH